MADPPDEPMAEGPDAKEASDAASATPSPAAPTRRGALSLMVLGGGALYAGGLAVPAYKFMATEGGGGGGERWFRLVKLNNLADGKPTRLRLVGEQRDAFTIARGQILGSVWLIRSGKEVKALSAICPHLGCAIDLGSGDKFSCPCHTSSFTLEGVAEDGPSPRAMDELTTRIIDGFVEVDFRNFKLGVKEKVEA